MVAKSTFESEYTEPQLNITDNRQIDQWTREFAEAFPWDIPRRSVKQEDRIILPTEIFLALGCKIIPSLGDFYRVIPPSNWTRHTVGAKGIVRDETGMIVCSIRYKPSGTYTPANLNYHSFTDEAVEKAITILKNEFYSHNWIVRTLLRLFVGAPKYVTSKK